MATAQLFSPEYWSKLQISKTDLEALQTHLFEVETPLTVKDLAAEFVRLRMQAEKEGLERKQAGADRSYLPKDTYEAGEHLVFPSLRWQHGEVVSTRPGINPAVGEFSVLTVKMDDGAQRMFAGGLAEHALNEESTAGPESGQTALQDIVSEHGESIEQKLAAAFEEDPALVRIAGRWFPRGLLIDVGEGQLNLAEAALDMAQGEPLPTPALLKDVELPQGVNPKLAEFSLNRALQDDPRFDEVGPAGQVLWCLRRLEPEGVRDVPLHLRYVPIEHDRSVLDEPMLDLEAELDDELSPPRGDGDHKRIQEVNISLIYPHLRAGTLPLSHRTRALFPTAYESPRVRFTLVDARSGIKMPAWVVREHGYVFGLREWYKTHQLIPGSLVTVRRGEKPGEVVVEARTQRSSKDWIRTLMVGTDGGLVFAMLKQPITAEFNDRMAIHVGDFDALDPLWTKQRTFPEQVAGVMREMTKLTPQGHVHAQELYSAINLVRRVPPGPLLALLATGKQFVHVGDLHFRLEDQA